jgi:FKBP-type peptidyl-prolyl cis-trans isomerase FkpA
LTMLFISCNKISYKKTSSGLVYKIFPGNGKDSLKTGQFVKFQFVTLLNDSVIYNSNGKMPGYSKVQPGMSSYNLIEILPLMKKGDSAITVQVVDTMIRRGDQLPQNAKKGDHLTIRFRIIDVFATDSLAMKDYSLEVEKDRPRQEKEQQEQMQKMMEEQKAQQLKEDQELEKSGEIQKEFKAMDEYLAARHIQAQRVGKGTYVYIKEQGTGAVADSGKYVNVKYNGRILTTDSSFQANSYAFQLGTGTVIKGWDEGLQGLKQGTKATLFIPGFLAYGQHPPNPTFKAFEALKFDVEILQVSDTPIANRPQQ